MSKSGWNHRPLLLMTSLSNNSNAPTVATTNRQSLLVKVDSRFQPNLPKNFVRFLNPEIQNLGPLEFSAHSWDFTWSRHPDLMAHLKSDTIHVGPVAIHKWLCKGRKIRRCLGLRDLEAIRLQGPKFFQGCFADGRVEPRKNLFGWKSAIELDASSLRGRGRTCLEMWVPYLASEGEILWFPPWTPLDYQDPVPFHLPIH